MAAGWYSTKRFRTPATIWLCFPPRPESRRISYAPGFMRTRAVFPRTENGWRTSRTNPAAWRSMFSRFRPRARNGKSRAITADSRSGTVDIAATGHVIRDGIPHVLFEAVMQDAGARNRWVVSRDGQKFLAVVPVNENAVDNSRVILNWPSLLRRK